MSFIITSGLESNTVQPYPSKLITQGYGSNPTSTPTGISSGRHHLTKQDNSLLEASLLLNALLLIQKQKQKEKTN
jgi:hypothetical protein